ncbi:MAG: response regulator [Rhodospirillales bacterium]
MEPTVLFISPNSADAKILSEMLAPTALRLDHAGRLEEARNKLAKGPYRVVVTEAKLPDGEWTDVIELTYEVGVFPAIIVTASAADDLFWAEVLNLGAYDLLAQPFDEKEVRRILTNASLQVLPKPVRKETTKLKSISANM